jgi:hypothetical protein
MAKTSLVYIYHFALRLIWSLISSSLIKWYLVKAMSQPENRQMFRILQIAGLIQSLTIANQCFQYNLFEGQLV